MYHNRFLVVLLSAALLLSPDLTARARPRSPAASSSPVASLPAPAGPNTPGSFRAIPNVGQFDSQVRFQIRTPQGIFWLTDDALWWIALGRMKDAPLSPAGDPAAGRARAARGRRMNRTKKASSLTGVNLRLTFPGMQPGAHIVPLAMQPTTMNYFTASSWHVDVPTYAALRWENIYPGVNLVLHAADTAATHAQALALTVETTTPAALSSLQLQLQGAETAPTGDTTNQLVASTPLGLVALPLLLDSHGQPLLAHLDRGIASFTSPPSPSSQSSRSSLPSFRPSTRNSALSTQHSALSTQHFSLSYSTFLGSSDTDLGDALAIDQRGSAYVAGWTASAPFPAAPGVTQGAGIEYDVLVTKLDPTGSTLEYIAILGGQATEDGYAIAVDRYGAAYLTGWTASNDFPTTPGAFDTTYNGGSLNGDAFVTKLSPRGNALVYSTFLGGSDDDFGDGIAVDATGTAYVSGRTQSADYPVTPNAIDKIYNEGGGDALVTRLNARGSALIYSTFLGGTGDEEAMSIAVTTQGVAVTTGVTNGADFPTTPGAYDTTFNGLSDTFIAKINPQGSRLLYSTLLGGSGGDCGFFTPCTVALDAFGAAYIAGYTESPDFPTTPGAYDRTCGCAFGIGDAFITKLTTEGDTLVYSTFLGGGNADCGFGTTCAIAVDATGVVYISGETDSRNFPTTPDGFDTTFNGCAPYCGDAFLSEISPTGSTLVYSTFLGGNAEDVSAGVAVGSDGSVYLAGYTQSRNFPTTPGAFDTTYNGGGFGDAFAVKFVNER